MIILHQGVDDNHTMHIGYATVVDGVARIITAQSKSIEVKLDSIQPIVDDGAYSEDLQYWTLDDFMKLRGRGAKKARRY